MTLLDEARQMLDGTIIPFWRNLHDNEYGGYFGWMNFDLTVDQKAVKGCILNSRVLWFFSTAALVLKSEADHAYTFLRNAFLDQEYGGVYWSVNYDGSVCDETKHTYNQAFAIYALSAYYRLLPIRKHSGLPMKFIILSRKSVPMNSAIWKHSTEPFPAANEKLNENWFCIPTAMI